MAATILPPGSSGSFLDSPTFSHTRTRLSPTGFDRLNANLPRTSLRFDISGLEEDAQSSCRFSSKLNTPDSGFFGAASSTPLKTPESDFSSTAVTPQSGGSGSGQRKRKTVTIDESQTSIVVISPDDLFNTYSKLQGQRQDQPDNPGPLEADPTPDFLVSLDDSQVRYVVDPFTGWPLRRSESLESRDNPFLPGGELSREAEDLLSRATIIRDHFYLNEDEKRTLREHQQKQQQEQHEQQEKQQRNAKHVHIVEHTEEAVASSDIKGRQQSSTPSAEAVEERISPQANNLATAAPASSLNGGDNHQLRTRENGKVKAATASSDNDKLAIPDGENQSHPAGQTDRTGTGDVPAQILGAAEVQVQEPDKKRRNKCCSIM